jgi:type II secretory pathway component GspD/PulD (secretin)
LPHTETVRDFQGIVTTIRSVTDLRWAFTYNAPRAFVMRGTPEKIEMTEWLVQQFDQRVDARLGSSEYRVKGAADDLVRVYFAKHVENAENLQELVALIRSGGNIRRLFTTGQPISVVMRGTDEEMGLADWLLQKLDQPTSGSAGVEQGQSESTREFPMSSNGEAVRVFYLRNATVQAFQNVASEVRVAGVANVFTYNALGALAVRGTADQIAAARNLIDERFKNSQQ